MRAELISTSTVAVIHEYLSLISDFFPGITNVDEFVLAFNAILENFQDQNKKKMDPYVIRSDRAVSCSSAAAIMGLWHYLTFDQIPELFVERPDSSIGSSGTSRATTHTKIAVTDNSTNKKKYYHLTLSGNQNLKPAKPALHEDYRKTKSIGWFVANRLSRFGLSKETIIKLHSNKNLTKNPHYYGMSESEILSSFKALIPASSRD
jgi:hypothetical protein